MKKLFYIISIIILCIILADEYESEEEEIHEEVYNRMDYIIDNIYLGDSDAAADEDYLKSYNISTVVNCAEELVSNYTDLKFMELKLFDYYLDQIFPRFEIAYKYIKRHSENNILIHCAAGMSRSASLVIFYIMKEKKWDYDTCLNYTRERRPVVWPNEGFEEQLRNYYEKYIK